jgi:hypothetical protein
VLLFRGMLIAPARGVMPHSLGALPPTFDAKGSSRPLIFSRSTSPDKSLAPPSGPCITCGGVVGHYRYLGIKVPSVPSLRSYILVHPGQEVGSSARPAPQLATTSAKREAKGRPHTKFQGKVWAHHVVGVLTSKAH